MGEGPQYPPPPRADDRFAIWSQQVAEILERISHRWKGEREEFDRGTNTTRWVRPEGSVPLMNDQGIDYCIGQMEMFANKVTFLSTTSADEIYRIVRINGFTLASSLYRNWERYDIRPHNFEEICISITTFFFFAAKRSLNGDEKDFLKTTGIDQLIRQQPVQTGPRIFG